MIKLFAAFESFVAWLVPAKINKNTIEELISAIHILIPLADFVHLNWKLILQFNPWMQKCKIKYQKWKNEIINQKCWDNLREISRYKSQVNFFSILFRIFKKHLIYLDFLVFLYFIWINYFQLLVWKSVNSFLIFSCYFINLIILSLLWNTKCIINYQFFICIFCISFPNLLSKNYYIFDYILITSFTPVYKSLLFLI